MIDLEQMEQECWGLDVEISKVVLPRLLYFKNFMRRHGIPADFVDHDTDEIYEDEWNECLELMCFAFSFALNNYEWADYKGGFDYDREKGIGVTDEEEWAKYRKNHMKHYAKYVEGMKLFSKYFSSLWD